MDQQWSATEAGLKGELSPVLTWCMVNQQNWWGRTMEWWGGDGAVGVTSLPAQFY